MGDEDRREHFRVEDEVILDYRRVDAEQIARQRAAGAEDAPSAFSLVSHLHHLRQESIILRRAAERESASFARLVDMQDRKIEGLAEVLMMHELRDRTAVRVHVDIGADGMGLRLDEPLEEGQWLEFRVVLLSTGLGLHSYARVVHCRPDAEGGFVVGTSFEFIREHDREMLVHHVLQRQSMMLRQRHNDDD
ncbi:MAG: PilZ domain-containing protein [Ectothiorhodospiraceae bacterium]|jgi:hypothetical protein